MNEATKKKFDAPWELFSDPDNEVFQIESKSGNFIAEAMMFQDAVRIQQIPELYEALVESSYEHCRMCLYSHVERASEMPSPNDMATNGCQVSDYPHCPNRRWWKLLKKVGDK